MRHSATIGGSDRLHGHRGKCLRMCGPAIEIMSETISDSQKLSYTTVQWQKRSNHQTSWVDKEL